MWSFFKPNSLRSFFVVALFSGAGFACNPLVTSPTVSSGYDPGVQLVVSQSTLTAPVTSVTSGGTVVLTLKVADQQGNAFYSSSTQVSFSTCDGTSTGTLSSVNDLKTGIYQVTFTGAASGTPLAVHAKVNGTDIGQSVPIQVLPNANLNVVIVSGNHASATVATAIASPLSVKVTDSAGNAVSGVTIDWQMPSGGSLSQAQTTTDSQGTTTNAVTFGTTAGSYAVYAAIDAVASSQISFQETANPGSPSLISKTAGDAQTGTVGSSLPTALAVQVSDAYGNFIPSLTLDWSASNGASFTASSTQTSLTGTTSQNLTLGILAGVDGVTVTVHGSTLQASFSESAVAGAVSSLTSVSGTGQSGTASQSLAAPFVVVAKDVYGNPAPNITLDWVVVAGGGSFGSASLTTSSNGQSSQTLILGSTVGTNTATVTVHGQTSLNVTYTATSIAGSATTIATSNGTNQTGIVAHALAQAFRVLVTDANNNPVPNAQVDWTIVSGGGSVSAATSTSDSSGLSSVNFTLGIQAGLNRARATLHNTGGSVVFSATANADSPATLTISSGNNQSGVSGAVLSAPFVVFLTDSHGNLISGATVNFSVASGGGSISSASVATDANGLASTTLTLGSTNGSNTVTAATSGVSSIQLSAVAQSGGVSSSQSTLAVSQSAPIANGTSDLVTVTLKDANGNAVANKMVSLSSSRSGDTITAISATTNSTGVATFNVSSGVAGTSTYTATDTTDTIGVAHVLSLVYSAGTPSSILLVSGDAQTGVVGSALSTSLKVQAIDANGNAVPSTQIDYVVLSGGGSLQSASIPTDSTGYARNTLTLGNLSGVNQVKATLHNTSTSVTFNETATSGSAVSIALNAGNSQSGTAGSALASAFQIVAYDANGNVAANGLIDWSVSAGGGSVSNSSTTSDANGLSSTLLTLGPLVATNSVIATLHGTSSSVSFSASGVAGVASALTITSGNSQTAAAGSVLTQALQVTVKDSNGNLVPSSQIDWTVVSGAGSLSAASSNTNASGVASITYTLGAASGANNIQAKLHSAAATISFSETGVAGTASTIAVLSGSGQAGTVNAMLGSPFVAVVKDSNNNLVSGVAVIWAVTANTGTLNSCTSASDANGQSQCGYTLGSTSGTNTVTATVSGITTPASFSAVGSAGSASKLAFTSTFPTTLVAGTLLSSQPVVSEQDANGNAVSATPGTVTLAAFSDNNCTNAIPITASGAVTIAGTLSQNLSSGVATFSGIGLNRANAVYVKASASGLSSACSSLVTVTAGAYATSQSAVTVSANSEVAGSSIVATLTANDAYGNTNPSGLPAVSAIVFTSSAVGGTGSFGGVSSIGSGVYTSNFTGANAGAVSLGATISSTAVSNNANVTVTAAAASQLAFTVPPASAAVAGTNLASQPSVTIQDPNGNRVTTSSVNVTLAAFSDSACTTAIATTPSGGATLGGTLSLAASSGVANFTGITANKVGSVYVLASASGLTSACSTVISVSPGAYSVAQSVVTASAASVASGSAAVATLTTKDAYGNLNPTDLPVLASIGFTSSTSAGTGAFGSVSASGSGVYTANFTGANSGSVTLGATVSGTSVLNTASVTVTSGTAAKLVYSVAPPSSATAGSALTSQPQVTLQDANGNTVASSSTNVTLAAYSDSACTNALATTPSNAATLGGTLSRTTTSGLAVFSAISANRAGAVYMLASSSGVTSVCSNSITVSPGPYAVAQSTVTSSASTVNSGSTLTATLTSLDTYGNSSPSGLPSTSAILFTSSVVGGTGSFGATSSSGSGVYTAAFTAANAGSVTLGATISSSAVSNNASVTVNAGAASKLAFTTQPASTGTTSTNFAPAVSVQDAYGNTVTSAANSLTIAAFTDATCATAATGTLSGTLTRNATSGVVSFTSLTYSKAQTIFLQSTASGLTSVCSSAVIVSGGPVTNIQLSGLTSYTSGTCSAISIKTADQYGNVSAVSSNTTLNFSNNGSAVFYSDSGCVTSTSSTSLSSGASTGTFYFKDTKAESITVTAAASGLTSGTLAVASLAGAASQIVFSTAPSTSATAGVAFATQPVLTLKDQYNNVASSTSAVTLTAYTTSGCTSGNASSTTIGATINPVSAVSGVATFAGVNYTESGTFYLQASGGGFTACSSAIVISAAAASQLVFTVQPSTTGNAGVAFTTQPAVTEYDPFNNLVTTGTASIALTAFSDSVCGTSATGTITSGTKAAVAGVSTFSGFTYSLSGTVYFRAASSGLWSACSSAIVLPAGNATQFVIKGPAGLPVSACSSAYTVTASDSSANAANVTTSKSITLGGKGSGAFYSDSTCTTGIGSLSISSGSSAATFYFKDATAEALTLTATDAAGAFSTGNFALTVKTAPLLAVGYDHTCVALGGGVQCWGNNNNGQLGVSTNTTLSGIPILGTGLTSNVTSITSSYEYSCVVQSGAVKCWGLNTKGNLGSGTTTSGYGVVTAISSGATMVAAGYLHVCAVVSGGVWCWGYNNAGQLGNNSTTDSSVPVQVSGLTSGVSQVAAGAYHTCALLTTGAVKCWGLGTSGQLGNGLSTSSLVPVSVSNITNATSLAASYTATCALVGTGGAVQCWGAATNGQLGNGTTASSSSIPNAATGSLTANVTAISANPYSYSFCAIVNGATLCWGLGTSGQLGNNSTSSSSTAVQVQNQTANGSAVSVGGTFACSITNGQVTCWGNSIFGQIGNALAAQKWVPQAVPSLTAGVTSISVSQGASGVCALVNGGVQCWGQGPTGNASYSTSTTPVQVTGIPANSGATAVAVGNGTVCAIVNGAAQCWGTNVDGALGYGQAASSSVPVQVTGLTSNVTSISVGLWFACAVQNGAAYCWGNNGNGQLGNNSTTNSSVPVPVTGLTSNVVQIITQKYAACALINDGTVYCWGYNNSGSLGNGGSTTTSVPVQVTGLGSGSGVIAISAQVQGACALFASGTLQCWGPNNSGALGNGPGGGSQLTPGSVQNINSGASYLAVSSYASPCVLVGGSARCWGWNNTGQVGNNSQVNTYLPAQVQGLTSGVTAIASGTYNACAVVGGGAMCWGDDTLGAVGIGGVYQSLIPVTAGPFN